METWVTKELASYAVEVDFEDHPPEVVETAKSLILDSVGCMLGGSQSKLGRTVVTAFAEMEGRGEATIVGGGKRVPCIHAAFVNGTTGNALDYDEVLLGMGHPGTTNIPAALAVGEWTNASGKEVLAAILAAYDVGNRIGKAIQPSYERLQQVWGVGTWQTFGAVVGAGKVLGLDLDQMLDAFGVGGGTAPLPNTQKWGWDPEERPLHWVKEPTGWPSWTGTLAAILAQNGFVGNRYILDGENGFWVMAGSDQCDFDAMTRGLGVEYEVERIAIKPYPACRWQHAALDCVRELKRKHGIQPDDVAEVKVRSFQWIKRQEIHEPADMVDAEFAIPYTVSMVLLDCPPGPEWYADENLTSERVQELASKVTVEVDPEIDRAYFEEDSLSSGVEITSKDGSTVSEFTEIPRGDPLNPLSHEEVEEKFRQQASYCLEEKEIDRVVEMIRDLETVTDVSGLMSLLKG